MLKRKESWQSELDKFLWESYRKPFAYGENDCCLWVADAVLAMTGTDIASEFRGKYRSRKEALDLCGKYSGKRSVAALVIKALGHIPQVPLLCAQRGDIVLVKRTNDASLGIISLDGRQILAAAARAFLRLPLSLAIRAWRV